MSFGVCDARMLVKSIRIVGCEAEVRPILSV